MWGELTAAQVREKELYRALDDAVWCLAGISSMHTIDQADDPAVVANRCMEEAHAGYEKARAVRNRYRMQLDPPAGRAELARGEREGR